MNTKGGNAAVILIDSIYRKYEIILSFFKKNIILLKTQNFFCNILMNHIMIKKGINLLLETL